MYTIYYIANNRMDIQHCATFETLTLTLETFKKEGAKILKVQNANGEQINTDLT